MNTQDSINQTITSFADNSSIFVVIVSYRSGQLVINALSSLKGELLNEPNMKVVVIDNSCGEDAKIILDAIDRESWSAWVTVIVSPRNGGFSYGNNLAIRPALKAERPPKYYWLLNPDTQIYSGAGVSLRHFLDENDSAGIVGSCLFNDDGNEWGYAFRFPTMVSETEQALQFGPFSRLVKNDVVAQRMGNKPSQVEWLPGASMMIRDKVFSDSGLFDENYFLYYEETDFCFNALSSQWSCWYLPESKVMHIAGQSTGATGQSSVAKRLPPYIYDSRYYYFTKNYGFCYTLVTDLVRIIAIISNKIIKFLMREPNKHRPYLLRDNILNLSIVKSLRNVVRK